MIKKFSPGSFDPDAHFYPEVINAELHPILKSFFNMSESQLVARFIHLHPMAKKEDIQAILRYRCKHFRWSGSDLIFVSTGPGNRHAVVIETNSCPSGQKSMPFLDENDPQKLYMEVINSSIKGSITKRQVADGEIAVLYDLNEMESSGYAATLADSFNREVYLVRFDKKNSEHIKYEDGYFHIWVDCTWKKLTACFRFVTQAPWNRIPVDCKTYILNPVISCLAGGRNKLLAKKAYDLYNAEIQSQNLSIMTPETITDLSKEEIPLWVEKFGGFAVIKFPYGNCGQGVYTITNKEELNHFMKNHVGEYDQYIVQSLIGNFNWSSTGSSGKYFHLGTIPNRKNQIFVSDLRFMVCNSKKGFKPVSIYGRRARKPLTDHLEDDDNSWNMLGTNLSFIDENGNLKSESSRLIMMDRRDFSQLGIGLDDIINAYIQTVLSTIAIDRMSQKLINQKGKLKKRLFNSLNTDPVLMNELCDE